MLCSRDDHDVRARSMRTGGMRARERYRYRTHAGTQGAREQYQAGSCCADRWTCLRVRARSMRTGGMRARERYCYRTHAGTQGAREEQY